MTAESGGESAEVQEEDKGDGNFPRLSRRKTIASVLGIGGLGVIGTSRRSSGSSTNGPRPWKVDVDAKGNDLFNLGSLTMAANSKAITDFEGPNLAIDDEGALTATSVSPWEDTDDDGQLETPNHDGIDVAETTTDQVTVGDGTAVTGIWGDSGELVPLTEYTPSSGLLIDTTTYEDVAELAVPFASLSFTNIEQVYVSLVGILEKRSRGATVSARIYDQTADTPLTSSEIQVTDPTRLRVPIDGPKVAYNPEGITAFSVQIKSRTPNTLIEILSPTIQVWGEIA